MSTLKLSKTRLRNGIWEGRLTGVSTSAPPPVIEVLFEDQPVPGVSLARSEQDGDWSLTVPIPAQALADGIQVFVIMDATSREKLGGFVLSLDGGEDDLHAEVALLRAELDMLKRAFRRHCVETI